MRASCWLLPASLCPQTTQVLFVLCIVTGALAFPSKPCTEARLFNDEGQLTQANPNPPAVVAADYLRLFVIGDYGVDTPENTGPEWKPTFDTERRNASASAMARSALYGSGGPVHLAVNVGDSFYQNGVRSTSDRRWNTTFDHVFKEPENAYWYAVMGNHDWYGNEATLDDLGTTSQINYTQNNPYNKWCAPALNYSFRSTVQPTSGSLGFTVDWIFIDTNSMLYASAGGCRHPTDDYSIDNTAELCRGKVIPVFGEQLEWLEDKACGSDADWVAVVGHHPLVSAGEVMSRTVPQFTEEWVDANAEVYGPEVVEVLRKWFIYDESFTNHTLHRTLTDVLYRCKVDVFFAGHEHMTQFLRHERPGVNHVMYQLGFGDNGNSNLADRLRTEPYATACMVAGQCFANESTVQASFGPHWFLDYKDVNGAFGDIRFYKDRIVARPVGAGTDSHPHVLQKASAAARDIRMFLWASVFVLFALAFLAAILLRGRVRRREPARSAAEQDKQESTPLDSVSNGSDSGPYQV